MGTALVPLLLWLLLSALGPPKESAPDAKEEEEEVIEDGALNRRECVREHVRERKREIIRGDTNRYIQIYIYISLINFF